MGGYIRTVSGQLLGKHFLAKQRNNARLLGSAFLKTQQLDYNNGRAVFYVVRAERL
jgi:hypothetical protein